MDAVNTAQERMAENEQKSFHTLWQMEVFSDQGQAMVQIL